jgi:hypothetical protein
MSGVMPQEMTAAAIIRHIEEDAYPRDVVGTMARGFLPLPQEELITLLTFLAKRGDEEVASLARTTLSEVPPRAIFEYASNEKLEGIHLQKLLDLTDDVLVLEALIRNRAVGDEFISELARTAEPRIQEVIVINQARILRAPAILDALLENPSLTADARRRALETREEFFEKRSRQAELVEEPEEVEEEPADQSLDAIADLLERAAGDEASEPMSPLSESDHRDPKKAAFWARLQYMSIAERVQVAFRGDRMARMLLVRDRNKLICSAVMRNPRMTDSEVESIAGMRNVEEEVLRILSLRRDWMSKYNVVLALCRNPRTPTGVVLPLINRLTLRDLKGLKDDKGVPQIVRETAKRFYLARTQKN